ncbi:hypothetical protein NUW54_g12942 [Trametes sanguinea]|uniref:Uncharacterized protein n=1 Tax=Trametes sanguinea TaxID=158606 RepID=A0ACC1MS76_9APHY|nr:hypothetical protein NUW54_g12942 [Trametes sanguinea]
MPSVHHPLGLVPLGLHPTPTQPGATTASVQGKDKRKQRCDVKRRRVCKRIENDLRKLPPKRGVTSRKLVLRITSVPNFVGLEDSRAEALEMAVDDPVDEFLPLDLSELVEGEDDPIEEFLSTDECSGMSSEIEGIEPASDWD